MMLSKINKWLSTPKNISFQDWLILIAPLIIFFSYQPLISLGKGSYGTHYEVSVVEIYLVIFAISSSISIWKSRQKLLGETSIKLAVVFALYNTVSIFWSPDQPRAILTSGLIWLLAIFLCSVLVNANLQKLKTALCRVFIFSAVLMSLFALYQFVAGLFPQTAGYTLLCPGCQANQFGFVRPNAFTVEPQFFGSLLSVAILLLTDSVIRKNHHRKIPFIIIGLLTFSIVLTMSRGALLSLAVGSLVLLFVHRESLKQLIIPAGIGVISFMLAITAQGIAAQINPTVHTSFKQAINTNIEQLSMGRLSIFKAESLPTTTAKESDENETNHPIFTGYIERSTNDRLSNSCRTAGIWLAEPSRMIFGVGVGGVGYYFQTEPSRSAPWCKTNS